MTIKLPDAAKASFQKQMAKAGYKDPAEYVLSLVERDQVRRRKDEIEEMLLEALKEPASPMTAKDWEWVRREGRRMIARRKAR
jgi:hypothetical protein